MDDNTGGSVDTLSKYGKSLLNPTAAGAIRSLLRLGIRDSVTGILVFLS